MIKIHKFDVLIKSLEKCSEDNPGIIMFKNEVLLMAVKKSRSKVVK